jgi:aspartyl-tRNA(Asn)/glutamyl-tRNA(Gln) amidotransferase subunit B
MHSDFRPVIGLEVHAQLAAQSKIFCPDPAEFGALPNTLVSPISLGHPGTLPTLNARCVELAIKMGLALNCTIHPVTYFARKNYFYPDLPKGYQISQDKTPICTDGHLDIRLSDGTSKRIRIQRIHMEEDAGKSLHDQDMYDTLVDLNRAGFGLIEIVSHPDIDNAEEAMAYMTEIRKLVRYLGISEGNMEEGSLRCDANVSVMRHTDAQYGTRCEVKNMNSISNIGRAINYEIERQIELILSGGKVTQQTRTWDAVNGQTLPLRDKESADDYRYFPEPDLQPLVLTAETLARLKGELPELPEARYLRYTQTLGLPDFDATMLAEQRELSDYYDELLAAGAPAKVASNWINGPIKNVLNERALHIKELSISPERLAALIALVESGQVSLSAARETLLPHLLTLPEADPQTEAEALGLILVNDTAAIEADIQLALDANPDKVQTYLEGKTGLLGFFVGQVKRNHPQADPKMVNQLLQTALEARRP